MLKINLSEERGEPEDSSVLSRESGPVPEGLLFVPEGKEPPAPPEGPAPPVIPEETALPAEESEAFPDEGISALEGEPFVTARRETLPAPEKVPLSSRESFPRPDIPPVPDMTGGAEPPEPETPHKKGIARIRMAALVVILIALAGFGVYTQKSRIAGVFARKHAPVQAAGKRPAQPAPAPKPAARADSTAQSPGPRPQAAALPPEISDPALAALGKISGGTPAHVWLTSATVSSDGGYELSGMSFSHGAMKSYAASLKTLGTVTTETIPAETAAPDTVYTFRIAGKLSGIKPQEILDVIPPAQLAALGDTLKTTGKLAGITFTRFPRANVSYGDSDLPFEAEGTYEGIKVMLGDLAAKSALSVFRISVRPAASGQPYNRVRAAFSLRAVSKI